MLRFIEQNWFLILFVVGMFAMHFGQRGRHAGHGGMGGCGSHAGHSTHSERSRHAGYDDQVGHSALDHAGANAHGPTRSADDAQLGVRDAEPWGPQDSTGPQDRTAAAAGRESE